MFWSRDYDVRSPLYRKRHCVQINDNSQRMKLHAKERAFVTTHVNKAIGKRCKNIFFLFFVVLESK